MRATLEQIRSMSIDELHDRRAVLVAQSPLELADFRELKSWGVLWEKEEKHDH